MRIPIDVDITYKLLFAFVGAINLFGIINGLISGEIIVFLAFLMVAALTGCLIIPVLYANIMMESESITLNGSIFFNKTMAYKDIRSIRLTTDSDMIERGHPVYSKNTVLIECFDKRQYYVSVKEPQSFMDIVNDYRLKSLEQ